MRKVTDFRNPNYIWDHDKIEIQKRFNELCNNGTFRDLSLNQMDSVYDVVKRQGIDKLKACYAPTTLCDYVGLQFEHIFIGIETDGYAHS